MKFAYDVPGYVQGHRFSDEADYYDSVNQRFYDISGFNRFGNHVEKVVGTPTFANRGSNSRRGLYLDNTNQWKFPHACPWTGSGLIVAEFSFVTTSTTSFHPHIFSELATVSSNPKIRCGHNSGNTTVTVAGPSDILPSSTSVTNNQLVVIAWSRNQEDRISRITKDGVTVTATAPLAAATNGNSIGMLGQPRCRLGNLNGTDGNTTASTTGTLHLFEQHFWKGDVLRDNLPELKAFIDTLKAHYGIA